CYTLIRGCRRRCEGPDLAWLPFPVPKLRDPGFIADMPRVFVISEDWSLRALVRAELLHAGVHALGMDSVGDLAVALARGDTPSAIVLDAAAIERATGPTRAALAKLARRVPIVLVAYRSEISGKHATPLEGVASVLVGTWTDGACVARLLGIQLERAA